MNATRRKPVRRALALILHWERGALTICNFVSGKVSKINPELIPLLDALKGYASLAALSGKSRSSASILKRLLAHDILAEEGSPLALKEEALFSSWSWDLAGKHFHFATNSVDFEARNESVWRALERKKKAEPPPSPFRELDGEYLRLPSPGRVTMDIGRAFFERRTCRSFLRKPIELKQLSTLLGLTWGVSATSEQGRELGQFVLKTSPSGGARHPTEVFVLVSRVRDLEPGIYHYAPRLHALRQIRSGDPSRLAQTICAKQQWVGDAAATFIMTAVVSRTMWKYEHSHAYRVLFLDAGHLGQTFHLACVAMGLGPFTTAALNGAKVEKALGIDGIEEIVVYAAATGLPRKASAKRPV